jgi:hypothetical protein
MHSIMPEAGSLQFHRRPQTSLNGLSLFPDLDSLVASWVRARGAAIADNLAPQLQLDATLGNEPRSWTPIASPEYYCSGNTSINRRPV